MSMRTKVMAVPDLADMKIDVDTAVDVDTA